MSSLASCDKMHGAIICFLSSRASWLLSWHFEALEIIWGVCWDRLRGPTTEGMDKITFSIAVAFSGVVDDDVSNFGIFEIVWCARWPHGRGHGHNCCLVSFQRSLLPHYCLENGLLESEKADHLAFCNICIVFPLYRLTRDVKRGTWAPPAERQCWCQGCCLGRILRSILVPKGVGVLKHCSIHTSNNIDIFNF